MIQKFFIRKGENSNLKRYMYPNFHSNTIYNIQDMETVKCPPKMTGLRSCGMYVCMYVYMYTNIYTQWSITQS